MSSGESPSIPNKCRWGKARESAALVIKAGTIGMRPTPRKAGDESRAAQPEFFLRCRCSPSQAIRAITIAIAITRMPL